jgi:3-hydroxy-9,10-secoandrosta-1,3,5(10)-triene-9,17-dione monooxygenase reductase component
MENATPREIDSSALKEAFRLHATGLVIVSVMHDGKPVGFTCQSFCSVSVDPPLVSFNVMASSTTYPHIRAHGKFCVNILAASHEHLSSAFATKRADKWDGVAWSRTKCDNPAINNAVAWFDCSLVAEHEAGDHMIVVGGVDAVASATVPAREPLVYHHGGYRTLAPTDQKLSAGL